MRQRTGVALASLALALLLAGLTREAAANCDTDPYGTSSSQACARAYGESAYWYRDQGRAPGGFGDELAGREEPSAFDRDVTFFSGGPDSGGIAVGSGRTRLLFGNDGSWGTVTRIGKSDFVDWGR
ncbi:MAG: hypothetical protein Kilf2KO_08930 [Rhodospirillales bacterium]